MRKIHRVSAVAIAAAAIVGIFGNPVVAQSKSGPTITSPAAPSQTTTTPPPSAIGTPMTSPSPIAPLSPQITTTPLTGGTVRTDKLPSPTPPSSSPSETAQSTAGGGGRTLEDCLKFWDRGTHMTKSEWRAACARSQHRLDNLEIDNLTLGLPKKPTAKNPRAQHRSKGRRMG